MLGRNKEQNKCFIILVNETARKVSIKKVKTEEGLIHYSNKSWMVETDPLFYKNQALYIVSDKKLITFGIEINEELEEIKEGEKEKQKFIRAEDFTPTALRKVATSEFFKALMAPLYWTWADWVKGISVGVTLYIMVKWLLLSIFKVTLP